MSRIRFGLFVVFALALVSLMSIMSHQVQERNRPKVYLLEEGVQVHVVGKIDYQKAPIGISVVRGRVKDVIGESTKAESAVDGMAGATLTGNGVTKAYKDTLSPYRPFFQQLANENK